MLSIKQCLRDIANRFKNIFNWIIEETTQGDYHVIKYANGQVELFARSDNVLYTKSSSWGYSYYSSPLGLVLPIELTSVDYVRGSVAKTHTYDINIIEASPEHITYRFVSYSHDWNEQPGVTIMFYIRGRWK